MSDKDERELLSAALLAQTGRTQGAPPTDQELADWVRRRLQGPRLEEVESHVAIRPEVFSRAMRFRRDATAKRQEPRTRKSVRRWFEPLAQNASRLLAVGRASTTPCQCCDNHSQAPSGYSGFRQFLLLAQNIRGT